MANAFKNSFLKNATTSFSNVYVCPAATPATVIGMTIGNSRAKVKGIGHAPCQRKDRLRARARQLFTRGFKVRIGWSVAEIAHRRSYVISRTLRITSAELAVLTWTFR